MAILPTLLLSTLLSATTSLRAEEPSTRRTISTEGESVVKVVPDEVMVSLEVSNLNLDLGAGRKLHAQRVQAVIDSAKAAGIEAKDIQTDFVQIQPEYHVESKVLSSGDRKFDGYRFRTNLAVLLRDISKFEALLGASLTSGADTVHGIQFRTSQLRKHRDAARAAALRAAREKAIAMATELGQKVGAPRTIQEGQGAWSGSYRSRYQSMSQNSWATADASGTQGEGGLAPGMISIQATVSVTFDLE